MEKIIYWLAHQKFKFFLSRKLIQELRATGKSEEADALEKLRHQPAPKNFEEMIQQTTSQMVAQGRSQEARQFEEFTREVRSRQKMR